MMTKSSFKSSIFLNGVFACGALCRVSVVFLCLASVVFSGLYLFGLLEVFTREIGVLVLRFSLSPSSVILFVVIMQYVVIGWLIRSSKGFMVDIVLGFMVLLIYLTFQVQPLGDHDHWVSQAKQNTLWASELLSNFLYYSVQANGLDIRYIAPVFGFFVFLIYMALGRKFLFDGRSDGFTFIYRVGYWSIGVSGLYFFDYIENTLLSIPFVLLYFYFSLSFLVDKSSGFGTFVIAGVMLALACLFHGQNLFLLPSIYFILFFNSVICLHDTKEVFRRLVWVSSVFLGVMSAVFFMLSIAGFGLSMGNVVGGGDGKMFVSISSEDATIYSRYFMFSFDHLLDISRIVVQAAPTSIVFSLIFLLGGIRKLTSKLLLDIDPVLFALGMFSCCYIVFAFLWNFDLGFPIDLDLMVSLGVSIGLFSFYSIYLLSCSKRNSKAWLYFSIFFGAVLNVSFISTIVSFRL